MDFTPWQYLRALEEGTLRRHPGMLALALDDPDLRPAGSLGAQAWAWAGTARKRSFQSVPEADGDEDPVLRRLAEIRDLTLADASLFTDTAYWRFLALPHISYDAEWEQLVRQVDYDRRPAMWSYLLRTGQTAKCVSVWRWLGDRVTPVSYHDTDWVTLEALYPDPEDRPEIDLTCSEPLRDDVLEGLIRSGHRQPLAVYTLADYANLDRQLVLSLVRGGVLQLTHLDRPWWISEAGREHWRELDDLVPGWADQVVSRLTDLWVDPGAPDSRGIRLASLCCPESGVAPALRSWLVEPTLTPFLHWCRGCRWFSRCVIAYLLLCGTCTDQEGRYIFSTGPGAHMMRDLSTPNKGSTVVCSDGGSIELPISREMVEEYILPLRVSWNWVPQGKSARSVVG